MTRPKNWKEKKCIECDFIITQKIDRGDLMCNCIRYPTFKGVGAKRSACGEFEQRVSDFTEDELEYIKKNN